VRVAGSNPVVRSGVRTLSHEDLVRKVERWQQSIHTSFDSHDGRYLKLLGDGCFALFDTPATAVSFAVACKADLVRAGAESKGSIHFGPVELLGDDVVGHSPMLTAALLRCAEPGQIVVSPLANELLRATGIELEPLGMHPIPGQDVPWQLFVAT
jgi:class 3 adenylate cyclase